MLGKTNIRALSEGAIATEIEDFSWLQVQLGIRGDFVKAVYKGGYLAAITADGSIAYTTDGEVWEKAALEFEDCILRDIDWDGERYIMVGSYSDDAQRTVGLIAATEDFMSFENLSIDSNRQYDKYYLVYPTNGKYILLAHSGNSGVVAVSTDLTINGTKNMDAAGSADPAHVAAAKNSSGAVVYTYRKISFNNQKPVHTIYRIGGEDVQLLESRNDLPDQRAMSALECKDILYCMNLLSAENYDLKKVTDSNEIITMCTGQNFMFVDGVYFNGCQLFINSHSMLVLRKGEDIADKTVDDLVEIAPELTMNCIAKAFGRLYIFGNQGIILQSSAESDKSDAIAVQALSAKRALADAKIYTDARYAELEARIAALEERSME